MKAQISLLLFITSVITSCNYRVVGEYYRNTAEGWRNFTDEQGNHIEVIPQSPNYVYFKICWNHKVQSFYYRDGKRINSSTQQHWKIKGDTLTIIAHSKRQKVNGTLFKKVKYTDRYYFGYVYPGKENRNSRYLQKNSTKSEIYSLRNEWSP
jgi:hypothetical protein